LNRSKLDGLANGDFSVLKDNPLSKKACSITNLANADASNHKTPIYHN
jgi:hypothetical protein